MEQMEQTTNPEVRAKRSSEDEGENERQGAERNVKLVKGDIESKHEELESKEQAEKEEQKKVEKSQKKKKGAKKAKVAVKEEGKGVPGEKDIEKDTEQFMKRGEHVPSIPSKQEEEQQHVGIQQQQQQEGSENVEHEEKAKLKKKKAKKSETERPQGQLQGMLSHLFTLIHTYSHLFTLYLESLI